MIELLRGSAAREPSGVAVISDDVEVTYETLLANAEAAAAQLVGREIGRFGIVHQNAALVISLLAAASLQGAEACVYPPLDEAGVARDTAARFDHDVVVSDDEDLDVDADVIRPADLFSAGASTALDPPSERPVLILTTGTTGEPRGARHDWARLLRPTRRVEPAAGERWLLAYGMHQFAGYQVAIHVAAAGATLVAPIPRRPRQGLAAIRRHRVTHVSATPTFWRFLLAEMRSDGEGAPRLTQITLGGEAIPGPLIGELEEAFPEARVSQVYAGSEFGPTGSVRDGRHGLPASVLERGEDADVAFKVVDGELWVRSRVGMLGYHGHDPIDPDRWRPTGDLVDVEEGRLFFRGRASDVINVGGVKVHPLPIEDRVASLSGVVLCRVFGRPNALTGEIVAVEIVAADGTDTEELEGAIRDACATLPPAARPRTIRFVSEITTRGEKIQRRANV